MKYSYNWLKELSGTTKSASEIAELITMHSFEVESVEKVGSTFEGFVVGEILEIAKHPNADKLQLTNVDISDKVLDIVCGAHNISVGDKVPVALVGTKLPDGSMIKEAEIRGEKSFGMLCAEDELGLGKNHEGILLLDKNIEAGTNLNDVLGGEDWAIDIKVLPDRGHDAISHVGMAREIVALEGAELDYDYDELILPKKKAKNLAIKIEDNDFCQRYIGAVMTGVVVENSPRWMQQRLEASGIKAVNNVVDATNYVMLELGQPLHAFDVDVIGNDIVVRRGKKDEEITLLDGSVKKIITDDIIIANNKEALALAGIMGGKDSGISEKTTNIILEAANFKPLSIRRTRSRLGLLTDASMRFEKELDPNLCEKALVRVIEILEHIAGATFEGFQDEYSSEIKPWKLQLDIKYINKLLGVEVPAKTSEKILISLGMKTKVKKDIFEVEVPTFRVDLRSQEDLIEEIGRIYGYDKIENVAPCVPVSGTPKNEGRVFERATKNILVGHGFSEVYNYSFYGPKDVENAGLDVSRHLELEMPMSPEQSLLRVSLIPNILKNVKVNLKNFKEFHIFEIGKIYLKSENVLPEEKSILTGAIVLEKKSVKAEKADLRHATSFFEAKAVVDKMLNQLGIVDHYYDDFEPKSADEPMSMWHETRRAEIKIQPARNATHSVAGGGSEESLGFVGEINPLVLERFNVKSRVAMFEFEMEKLQRVSSDEREYQPISKYPLVTRDISMIVENNVRIDEILQTIQKAGGNIVQDVDLFDAIDFSDGTSSFAFHIIFGTNERTLTGKEIDEALSKIMDLLERELGVKIRR